MNVVSVTAGVAIVFGIALDMALTVLHPTIRGAFSHRLTRGLWRVVRAVSIATRSRRALTFAGPLATVGLFISWLGGLWLGFALIYLPFVDQFSATVHFAHRGAFAALYASASVLTTLGLGDVLPTQDGVRVAVVCEAAAGVATVSAAISYVLSVYPLATQTRAHALYLSDLRLRSPRAACEYIAATGNTGVAEIHQRLIDGHQSLRRFPVLYYFHPDAEEESVLRLLESATVLCVVARWAPPDEVTPYGFRLAEGLKTTLELIRTDYLAKYVAGHIGQPKDQQVPAQGATKTLQFLRDHLASPLAEAPLNAADADQFAHFTSNMDHLLAGLARAHVYKHQPLLRRLGSCTELSSQDRTATAAVTPPDASSRHPTRGEGLAE
jgi:Ion channel